MEKFRYETCCIHSTMELIHALQEAAKPISRRTFLKHANSDDLDKLADSFGYVKNARSGGLTMAKDWHIGYYKSFYDGKPCYYFDHSRIEYIFTENGGGL